MHQELNDFRVCYLVNCYYKDNRNILSFSIFKNWKAFESNNVQKYEELPNY